VVIGAVFWSESFTVFTHVDWKVTAKRVCNDTRLCDVWITGVSVL
jgi:hypothetical protein